MVNVQQMLFAVLVFMFGVTGISVIALWYFQLPLVYSAVATITAFLICYVSLPIVFRSSKKIQRYFVYLASARRPPAEFDFGDTEGAGLAGCRNLYLFLNEGAEHVGVWHLLPHSLILEASSTTSEDAFWKNAIRNSGKHVVIYFHGNTGTRALEHRKELYWILQNLDCHVISFDYRGFADSSNCRTTEETTVEDGILVVSWIYELLGESSQNKVFIWGHSLGTGISSHVVAKLQAGNIAPCGLILESPFTNIGEALRHNKKAVLYRHLPKFKYIFVRPLHASGIAYETDMHIENITIPILILHALDDETVPFSLGKKLFHHGKSRRDVKAHPIHFQPFPKGHGHKLIHTAPELPTYIMGFMSAAASTDWSKFNCQCCFPTV